ncbi:MAG TPA: ABC transporter permease [Anaerolineales bacterium]|jgi:peptide/nickel transport system permease protein|nr:peptide ABC transporter permease [Anaerolineae bacterium]HRJ54921.1 ABC transporter permease [Anaerolineales bacterium]HRK89044.1 ABC transporter permease [Anaerolineales bacterium]
MATDIASIDSNIIGRETLSRKALTPGQLIWRRFIKNRMAVFGMIGFSLLMLFIIIGSFYISEEEANAVDLQARLSAPNDTYIMGTDSTGRDIFSRIVHGGQISLIVGITAVSISVTLGTLVGGLAGFFGGWVDSILMRFTEAMLSIPQLFLLIVLGKFIGRDIDTVVIFGRAISGSVMIVIFVIGLTSWMGLSRIVRANVLSLKEMDYVAVAKSLGSSRIRTFFRHLIPNTMGVIIVASTLGLAGAILSEAYVSFLGLGIQPPTASWGNMLTAAQTFVQQGSWWMWVFPSVFIIFTILCVNLMGDGLRDAFDPRSSRHL